jgi:antitoxin component YwqK of YwqJK toxin-antitoxin module
MSNDKSQHEIDPNEISFDQLTDSIGIDLSHSDIYEPIVFYKGKPLNGTCFERIKDGTITHQAEYKQGRLNGSRKYFDSDGKLWMEENYLKGKLHGAKTIYYDGTNQIWESWLYKNGEVNGEFISYTEHGTIKCKATFFHGALIESHGSCFFKK